MKRFFKKLWCGLRGYHKTSLHLRESDQRVLITVCDDCGLMLKARQLSKAEQREMRKMSKALKYRPPLIKA